MVLPALEVAGTPFILVLLDCSNRYWCMFIIEDFLGYKIN